MNFAFALASRKQINLEKRTKTIANFGKCLHLYKTSMQSELITYACLLILINPEEIIGHEQINIVL